MSSFNQEIKPFASSYWSPKYHVSLNPMVRHTRSNKSLPVDLHYHSKFISLWDISSVQLHNNNNNCTKDCDTCPLTSRLNSSSASKVQTLTGKDLPDFFLRNGDILLLAVFVQHRERHAADRYREGTRSYDKLDFASLLKNILALRRYFVESPVETYNETTEMKPVILPRIFNTARSRHI